MLVAALNYVELTHVFATSTCALDSSLNAEVRLFFGCPRLLPETLCSDMCSSRNLAYFLLLMPVRHTALLLERAEAQGIRKKKALDISAASFAMSVRDLKSMSAEAIWLGKSHPENEA